MSHKHIPRYSSDEEAAASVKTTTNSASTNIFENASLGVGLAVHVTNSAQIQKLFATSRYMQLAYFGCGLI